MPGSLGSPNKDPPSAKKGEKNDPPSAKKDKEKKKKDEKKKQEEKKTPEQLLQEMRPNLEKELEKANVKIAKTALNELINEVFPSAVYFGCQEGTKVGTIDEIKQAAKNYFLQNKELLDKIMQKPDEYIAETKKGHATDLLTHLQSQTRAFPVKTQKDPEAERISETEQKAIDESNERANGTTLAMKTTIDPTSP